MASPSPETNMAAANVVSEKFDFDLDPNVSVTIDDLNHEKMIERMGGIVFVGVLALVGLIGNLHVLYIYGTKFKKTNQRIFILFLGYLDLFTCIVGMPFIISDLLLPLKFTSGIACKVLRCTNYFTGGSSAFLLVVIAIERYKKICRPLKLQTTIRGSKITSMLALLLSLLLSWPAAILYGFSTVDTGHPGLSGAACYIEDKFKQTKYTTIFNAVIVLIIVIANVILVVLYVKVVRRVYKQKAFQKGNKTKILKSRKKSFDPGQTSKVVTESEFTFCSMNTMNASREDLTNIGDSGCTVDDSSEVPLKHGKPANKKKSKKVSVKSARVTMMLFIITVVYFCSFLPHLVLKILADVKKDFLVSLDFTGTFLYYVSLYTIFINNMANPIIYGFCDPKFMDHIRAMYRCPCRGDKA